MASSDIPLPHVSDPLLEYLDILFPDKCPNPAHTDREIWMRAGERRVVEKLRDIHDQMAEDQLKPNVQPK